MNKQKFTEQWRSTVDSSKLDHVFEKFTEQWRSTVDFAEFTTAQFDYLFVHSIPEIIQSYGSGSTMVGNLKHSWTLIDIVLQREGPTATQCIKFGLTLSAVVHGTLVLNIYRKDANNHDNLIMSRQMKNLFITLVPIPTGNHRLAFVDEFPYTSIFILRGKCRIIPATKRACLNVVLTFVKERSTILQVRSEHRDKVFRSTSTIELFINNHARAAFNVNAIRVRLPFQTKPINVALLAMACGIQPIHLVNIVRVASGKYYNEHLFRPFELALKFYKQQPHAHNQRSAIMLVSKNSGKSILSTGLNLLLNETFSHYNGTHHMSVSPDDADKTLITSKDLLLSKGYYIGWCISQLILTHLKIIPPIQRDKYVYNELDTSAAHLGSLLRLTFIKHMSSLAKLIRRTLLAENRDLNLDKLFGAVRFSARIASAVATGKWSIIKRGMSMSANLNNDDAAITQQRRISSSVQKTSGSHTTPREMQIDQLGFICEGHSPDGEQTGLVYVLAELASIAPPMHPRHLPSLDYILAKHLSRWLLPIDITSIAKNMYSYINTSGIFSHRISADHVQIIINIVRNMRRTGIVGPFVSVHTSVETSSVYITMISNQLVRPIGIHKKNNHVQINPFDPDPSTTALVNGDIEYIGAQEQDNHANTSILPYLNAPIPAVLYVAPTHIELNETTFGGVGFNSIPFVNSQQGPRCSYRLLQRKQDITANIKYDFGVPMTMQLVHAHKPLVTTKALKQRPLTIKDAPTGTPSVIAFIPLSWTQEDAILVNRRSVDFGMFDIITTKRYTSTCTSSLTSSTLRDKESYGGNAQYVTSTNNKPFVARAKNKAFISEGFGKAIDATCKQVNNYDNIESCGLPKTGTTIKNGDVVIGKNKTVRQLCNNTQRVRNSIATRTDISTTCTANGIVFEVNLYYKPTSAIAVVLVQSYAKLNVGDKFSTEHAQKGCISIILPQEDVPFSMKTGCSPDVVISSLAIPSRMTTGYLLEALAGKSVAIDGEYEHGIDKQELHISNKEKIKIFEEIMIKAGYRHDGTEMYCDGMTGEMIQGEIFSGIVDFKRLHHLAEKKCYARSTGPKDPSHAVVYKWSVIGRWTPLGRARSCCDVISWLLVYLTRTFARSRRCLRIVLL